MFKLLTKRQVLISSVALNVMMSVGATHALAQDAAPAANNGNVEEVVVTATRRAERLNNVPLSISAYSQVALDKKGVRDVNALAAQTPGLDVPTGRVQRIAVRGIDSNAGAATTAVYIDDTPIQARNASINYSGSTVPYIFDLDRIEVLRSPQGTLFGASSQGGAVRFITPKPSLTTTSGLVRAQVNAVDGGDFGYEFGAAGGIPVIEDKLAVRASVFQRKAGGWIDRQSWQDPTDHEKNANSVETLVGRIALNWEPIEGLSIMPSVYFQTLKQNDRGLMYTRCPATVALKPTLNPCLYGASNASEHKYINYGSLPMTGEDEFVVPSLKVGLERGGLNFVSVTSGLNRKVSQINDATYGNDRVSLGNNWLFPIVPGWSEAITYQAPTTSQHLFTQELRVSNADDTSRLRWTLGLYYADASLKSVTPIASPHYPDAYRARFGIPLAAAPFMVGGIYRYYGTEHTNETTKSVFGNVDFNMTPRLTLSLGARKSWEELRYDIIERGVSYTGGIASAAGKMEEDPFTPRVALSFQQSPKSLFYASYATGYRTGGVNKAVPDICRADLAALGISGGGTYTSDTTDSYELGWKGSILDNRLSVQSSVYHTKWSDIQQQIRLPCAFSLVANTASATSQGIDLNLAWRAADGLTLSAAVGYTDAEYDKTIQVGTAPVVTAGQTLGQTPYTLNLAADYSFTAFNGRNGYVRVQYNFRKVNDGPFAYQIPASSLYDKTRVVGASANQFDVRTSVDISDQASVEVFVENLFNNTDLLYEEPTYAGGPLWMGESQRPRVVGLQVTYRY